MTHEGALYSTPQKSYSRVCCAQVLEPYITIRVMWIDTKP